MGDMADYFLECVEEEEITRLEYLHGNISDLEAYDMGLVDEWGVLQLPGHQKATACKYCKKKPLYWEETERGWRLFDLEGKMHSCKEYHENKRDIWLANL